jgi:hypothetical protein
MYIAIVNKSTILTAAQLALMPQIAAAMTLQMNNEFALAWTEQTNNQVVFRPDGTSPPGGFVMTVIDNDGQAGALGYHDENADVPDSVIEAQVILGAGAGIIDGGTSGTGGSPFSLSSVMSHEVLELRNNPDVNKWAQSADGKLHSVEMCDAVQSGWYLVNGIWMSNFLTPKWFDPENVNNHGTNHMGIDLASFVVSPGGYEVYIDPSVGPTPQQIFGEHVHPAIKQMKMNEFLSRYGKIKSLSAGRATTPPAPPAPKSEGTEGTDPESTEH